MTTLKDIGESGLLKEIYKSFGVHSSSEIGVGDDAAVIHRDNEPSLLVTVDSLIEGTHFLRDKSDPVDLGKKALAVNLSDIASMGGVPKFAFLSFAAPSDLSVEWTRSFLLGFKTAAKQFGVMILGGDTVKSEMGIALSVTLIGECKKSEIKLRSGAKPGDIVCVTGFLGDSAGGLNLLLRGIKHDLVKTHLLTRPHVEEGIWLGKKSSVHAMMDISDGIAIDLQRLAESSGVIIEISMHSLPISDSLASGAEEYKFDPIKCATSGGEDYVLAVIVEKSEYSRLSEAFKNTFSRPLYEIGIVKEGEGKLVFLDRQLNEISVSHGFDNFTS